MKTVRLTNADLRRIGTAISSPRRKMGDAAKDSTYMFTELGVGYRMPKGDTREQKELVQFLVDNRHAGALFGTVCITNSRRPVQ